MNKPQTAARTDRRQPASNPLTLDYVLTEVVRILDEERANIDVRAPRRLAA